MTPDLFKNQGFFFFILDMVVTFGEPIISSGEKEELHQQMNSIYKIIPQVAFHTGVQALMLLFQVTDPRWEEYKLEFL